MYPKKKSQFFEVQLFGDAGGSDDGKALELFRCELIHGSWALLSKALFINAAHAPIYGDEIIWSVLCSVSSLHGRCHSLFVSPCLEALYMAPSLPWCAEHMSYLDQHLQPAYLRVFQWHILVMLPQLIPSFPFHVFSCSRVSWREDISFVTHHGLPCKQDNGTVFSLS